MNWHRAISTSGAIVGRLLNLSAAVTATAFDWIPLVRTTVTNCEICALPWAYQVVLEIFRIRSSSMERAKVRLNVSTPI
jgi:hypothetical protein